MVSVVPLTREVNNYIRLWFGIAAAIRTSSKEGQVSHLPLFSNSPSDAYLTTAW